MANREKSRLEMIRALVKGKRVLDVGCVDHEARMEERGEWLHRIITESAVDVIGLDLEVQEVEKLNTRGYRVIHGDAEEIDLRRTFEVIVAGELIEHLENPGRFLRNMLRHLEPGGLLVLTTPNPFYPKRLLEIMTHGTALVHPQHVSWFCPSTLRELLHRTGYTEIRVIPFNNSERMKGMVDALTRWRPWLSTGIFAQACRPES